MATWGELSLDGRGQESEQENSEECWSLSLEQTNHDFAQTLVDKANAMPSAWSVGEG